ncbi:MAG TPA: hypothetical protein VK007_02455 [Acidimicrobiales bacterium]|nr:hypothetical protein [Acidimicrobiales bacterium]
MQRQIARALVASGLAGLMGLAGLVAPAGEPMPTSGTMKAEPSTGLKPGDSFVVSNEDGSECPGGQVTGDSGGIRPGAWVAEMAPDGDWSVTIEIPTEGPPDAGGNPTPFPPGEYEIHAHCTYLLPASVAGLAAPAQQEGFDYDPITVTIVAPEQEAPPTTEAPAEEPPAAAPTQAAPTYTG